MPLLPAVQSAPAGVAFCAVARSGKIDVVSPMQTTRRWRRQRFITLSRPTDPTCDPFAAHVAGYRRPRPPR
jgi:hypothetical protein